MVQEQWRTKSGHSAFSDVRRGGIGRARPRLCCLDFEASSRLESGSRSAQYLSSPEVPMPHSMWPHGAAGKLPRNLVLMLSLAILFAIHEPSFGQIRWPFHSDRDLITKLYNGDFAHISDDNEGRMD